MPVSDVTRADFESYSIPIGVIGVITASFTVFSTLYYSIRAQSQSSMFTRRTQVFHAVVTILSTVLGLVSTIRTYIGVEKDDNLFMLAILTLLGTLVKQISTLITIFVPPRFTAIPGIFVDLSNIFHYVYGVLYVFTIRVVDSALTPSKTREIKHAGRLIVYICGPLLLPSLLLRIPLATPHERAQRYALAVARTVAACAAMASWSIGLVGLALATGNVWGVSVDVGSAVKWLGVVSGLVLALLIPAQVVVGGGPDEASYEGVASSAGDAFKEQF
ncbi:hypothetical protein MNV49_006948 [Pseudohyphozyma bogoriensis]|nr:hypothetical protein MNV49_006948 [Pseudohyphozyma bogoriensis]